MTQKSFGVCCFCIPIRTGIALICLYHFCHAFVCLYGLFAADIRLQSGGYNMVFDRVQVVVGAFGIIFAFTGLLGVYDNKVTWIKVYNYFQFLKLATLVVVFLADLYTLRNCETWYNKLESQIQYNAAMDRVSRQALCEEVRLSYIVGWILDVSMNFYFAWVCNEYRAFVDHKPAYLIQFDKNPTHLSITTFNSRMGEPGSHLTHVSKSTDTNASYNAVSGMKL